MVQSSWNPKAAAAWPAARSAAPFAPLLGLPYPGSNREVILHADRAGHFKSLVIDAEFYQSHVIQTDLWIKENDPVSAFKGANDAIGTLVLKFESESELKLALARQKDCITIELK